MALSPDRAEVIAAAQAYGWRISPMACAITFSHRENESPQFESSPHLKLISDKIVAAVQGYGKKFLIVSMPPRHGKSTLITKRTPQWFLGNYPHLTCGMMGYGNQFAQEWGRKIRNELSQHSELLGFTLAEDSQKADLWHTSLGGGMWTAGIRGEITGKGADLMIIDDPIKNDQEAYSAVERDALWNWWQGTAMTRTYPHSVVIVVMTRWHTDDFAGRLQDEEFFGERTKDIEVIRLPAIWEEDTPDVLGRRKGDALWPSHFPTKWLLSDRKAGMTPEYWEALYQQEPMNQTGAHVAYRNFDEKKNVREVYRNAMLPISWAIDFNVNPMTSVVAQASSLFGPRSFLTNEKYVTAEVLDEIVLPDSGTIEMCNEFYARYQVLAQGKRPMVKVYGDATANRRDTRGAESDWEIVYSFLRRQNIPFTSYVQSTDPLVRDRVNSMNHALCDPMDRVGLFVHPKCKELRKDLKEVRWKRDIAGNTTSQLDKKDPKRTHVSDALGYLIYELFKITGGGGEMPGIAR